MDYMKLLVDERKFNNYNLKQIDSVSELALKELYTAEDIECIISRSLELFRASSASKRRSIEVYEKKMRKLLETRQTKHTKFVKSFNKKLLVNIKKMKVNTDKDNKKLTGFIDLMEKYRKSGLFDLRATPST
jgi:hypothetical protein